MLDQNSGKLDQLFFIIHWDNPVLEQFCFSAPAFSKALATQAAAASTSLAKALSALMDGIFSNSTR